MLNFHSNFQNVQSDPLMTQLHELISILSFGRRWSRRWLVAGEQDRGGETEGGPSESFANDAKDLQVRDNVCDLLRGFLRGREERRAW